jgi:hypothetical protein
LIVAAAASISCFGHTSGDLRASKLGDISHPAARGRPDDAIVRGCGIGGLETASGDRMGRLPYLQRVASDSALVLFTARDGFAPALELTTPDGKSVRSIQPARDESARLDGYTQWVARLDGLASDTLYCYSLPGATLRTGFRTAPEKGSERPVRFIAFGDSGTGAVDQFDVMHQMQTVPFDLMLHTGDIAYDNGELHQFERYHFDVYAPLLGKFSFFPIAGNHDMRTDQGSPFRQVFALPENGGEGGRERWYSFDWGNVHFVALDTEAIGAMQRDWLEADLVENTLPWTVVISHKPPYSSGQHGPDREFQRWFVPVLERHQVDLVLSGHEHNYERFKPLNGVRYVVTGGGGRETRSVDSGSATAFSDSVLHFVYVDVTGSSLTMHAIDGTGGEFDSLAIEKNPG